MTYIVAIEQAARKGHAEVILCCPQEPVRGIHLYGECPLCMGDPNPIGVAILLAHFPSPATAPSDA